MASEKDIKLVCFDLDKTLIKNNSWLNLNLALGMSPEQDEDLLQEYLNDKISYNEWMSQILQIFKDKGMGSRHNIEMALSQYEYNKGAQELVSDLRQKGYQLALISGSINILVELVARELRIENYVAHNHFVFDENEYIENIVVDGDDIHAKAKYLTELSSRMDIPLKSVACIGDGDNDVEMFRITGNGITFTDSKIASEAWKVVDSLPDVMDIL
jgi:phosphoserine phosphatase